MFVHEYYHAVCFYYLSIQGISSLDAKTESNLDVNINAGGHVPGRSQSVKSGSVKATTSKHSTH